MYQLLKQIAKTGIITEPAPLPDAALRALEQPLELCPRQALERQQVTQRAIAAQLISHHSPSPANQRARITAAAALSMSARCTRRRRCPLARRAVS